MVVNKLCSVLCLAALLALSACSRQQSDWEKAVGSNTAEAYQHFLKKYPSGEFSAQAQARLKELIEVRDWQAARDADTLEAYQAFVKQYPDGKDTEEARVRIENLTVASVPPNGAPESAPATPAPQVAPLAKPAPSAPSAAAKTPSKAAGSYAVQLGAFKSGAAAANKHWAHLEKDYPQLLKGLEPKIAPKKVASGTLYRLQAANLSEKRAQSICKTLKAHAQPCAVLHEGHT
jgi:cell division protein FtsN